MFLEERLECFRVLKYDTEAERLPKSTPGQDKVGINYLLCLACRPLFLMVLILRVVDWQGYSRTRDLDGEQLLVQLPALQQLLYRLIGCRVLSLFLLLLISLYSGLFVATFADQ